MSEWKAFTDVFRKVGNHNKFELRLSDGSITLAQYDANSDRTALMIQGAGGMFWRAMEVPVEWRKLPDVQYPMQSKIVVTKDNVSVGLNVIDEDGGEGFIKSCDDYHNVLVNYDNGDVGIYCLINDCNEYAIVNNTTVNVQYHDPLYILE